MTAPTLNERASRVVDEIIRNADDLRVDVHTIGGARVLDCGVNAVGGMRVGLFLARICLADLAEVSLLPPRSGTDMPMVQVVSDQPVRACMASQYAGWQIAHGKYFAMGSGPMRAAYGKEQLFDRIPGRETPDHVVGCLEASKLPNDEVIAELAKKLNRPAEQITLLVAPTTSQAGLLQIVARSVETALHKLDELKFDLNQVVSGFGVAPLPPTSPDTITAIGRSNDAILYGSQVVLTVRAEDAALASIGPKVPASSSAAYGQPFAAIFHAAGGDFYKIDPMLFSPARIVFQNCTSGNSFAFGQIEVDILRKSFFGGGAS